MGNDFRFGQIWRGNELSCAPGCEQLGMAQVALCALAAAVGRCLRIVFKESLFGLVQLLLMSLVSGMDYAGAGCDRRLCHDMLRRRRASVAT